MSKQDTPIPADRLPAPGYIWQCGACGKTAEDLYGSLGSYSYGWDASCMLNAVQVLKKEADKRG